MTIKELCKLSDDAVKLKKQAKKGLYKFTADEIKAVDDFIWIVQSCI